MESRNHIITGAIAAVLLHIVVAAVICIPSVFDWLFAKEVKPEVVKVEEVKPVISLRITPRREVKPEPIPERRAPKQIAEKRFIQTSPQRNVPSKPKNPVFFGANDNVAQSSAAAEVNAPKIAASSGVDRNHINTESRFNNGDLNSSAAAPARKQIVTEIPAPPNMEKTQQQSVKLLEEAKPAKDDLTKKASAAAQRKQHKYLDASQKVATSQSAKKSAIKDPKAGRAQKTNDDKPTPEEIAKKAQREKAKQQKLAQENARKAGFKPRLDPTKNVGSIMRKGKISSNDTAATPEGRYKQAVLNAINKDWNRRMGRHPDLALPGVLKISWYVYAPGKVKSPRLRGEEHGSAIQKGITFQSISQAKIPKMPKEVQKLLNGEPMEFVITFYF